MADTNSNEKVGIGRPPVYKLDVSGTTRLSILRIGENGDQLTFLRNYEVNVGSSATNKLTVNAFGSYPSDYAVYSTVRAAAINNDDCFTCTLLGKSTSNVRFVIQRTDSNTGWGQSLNLQFTIIGV
jgi:hypothetical protein